jgi:hypothetical protein
MRLICAFAVACLSVAACLAARGPVPGLNSTTPYLVYYGGWDTARVQFAKAHYRLIILHTQSSITAAQVASLRHGLDGVGGTADDVLVLAYLSVGEDDRPGTPFVGDGLGPRVDPRASDSVPLSGITTPLGSPSPGGVGYASYYLDTKAQPDGRPDRNPTFGGCYVNAGAPGWWQVIRNMTVANDGRAGLEEILTASVGRGYNCDGVFLDTIDTAAPNSYGGTSYEWTAPGMQALVRRISTNYPAKLIMANRGLFFYNPNLKHYAYTLRPDVNLVMFESYYTDSSNSGQVTPSFASNKYDYAPKVNAEAGRPDGFTVVALDYDHAPPLPDSVVQQGYAESMAIQGWLLYRTNPRLDAPFSTASSGWLQTHPDTAPPEWDSTAARSALPPVPRVGAQEVIPGQHQATVRWDVARDQTGPVRYNIYFTTNSTLDFFTASKLAHIPPSTPASYLTGTGTGRYAFEHTVTGLSNGVSYLFAVRAEDACSPPHEDTNTVVLPAQVGTTVRAGDFRQIRIDGAFSDWEGIPWSVSAPGPSGPVSFARARFANDTNYLYCQFQLHNAAVPFSDYNTHVFVDTDNRGSTGYAPPGAALGSELMVESGAGYDERTGVFNGGLISGLDWRLAPTGSMATNFEFRVSRLARYLGDGRLVFTNQVVRLLLQDNRDGGSSLASVAYVFLEASPYADWLAQYFTADEFEVASLSAEEADADQDGMPNLLEYAFGRNPRVADRAEYPQAALSFAEGQTYLEVQFQQRNPVADVQYGLEVSTDLLTWSDATTEFVRIVTQDRGDGTSLVTYRRLAPLDQDNSPRFVRVRIRR